MTTVRYPGDALSRRERITYVLILGALTTLGPFSIDLYLPAFPEVKHDLAVGSGEIQLTLSATTLGFAIGQLLVGPLSDRFGRRWPLIAATALHVSASVGVALAPGLGLLIGFRFVQGMGAAAGAVVALATVRDLFGGYPMIRMISRLALVSGVAPMVAPVLGSQLLLFIQWRGIFLILAGYGACLLVAALFLVVETLPAERRTGPTGRSARDLYRSLLSDRAFLLTAIIGAVNVGALFAYLSSSSFIFQVREGLSAQAYGLVFAINAVGIMLGVQTSSRLASRSSPIRILTIAVPGLLLTTLAIVVSSSLPTGLFGILIPLWCFMVAYGFVVPCVQGLALAHHGQEAGTAASFLGALNFSVAALVAPVIGLFGRLTPGAMGSSMVVTSVIAVVTLLILRRSATTTDDSPSRSTGATH